MIVIILGLLIALGPEVGSFRNGGLEGDGYVNVITP